MHPPLVAEQGGHVDETGSDSLSTRIPYGRSWTIHVDEAYRTRVLSYFDEA